AQKRTATTCHRSACHRSAWLARAHGHARSGAWCHCRRAGTPSRRHAAARVLRPRHRRNRATSFAATEQTVAYAAEKTVVTRRIGGRFAFELSDSGVSALERFVLHQYGLHQRIGSVGGLPQAVPDQAFGVRIALGVFQRGQAVEQFDDEIAFLWGHWPSPCSRDDDQSCCYPPWQRNDRRQQKRIWLAFSCAVSWIAAPTACQPTPRRG